MVATAEYLERACHSFELRIATFRIVEMANVDVQKKVFKRKLKKLKSANKGAASKKPKVSVEEPEEVKPEPVEGADTSAEVAPNGAAAHETAVAENSKAKNLPEATRSAVKSSILTDKEFESLRGKVSDATLDAVQAMGFSKMTQIQAQTIEPLLEVSAEQSF